MWVCEDGFPQRHKGAKEEIRERSLLCGLAALLEMVFPQRAKEENVREMKNVTSEAITELEKITNDFRAAFGSLTDEQLNWKPAAESWSIAQCVDHLIKSNDEVQPVIDAKLAGGKNSFLESWSPLTGFFGGFLKKNLATDAKKFKAPSKAIVPPSDIDAGVLDRFAENQQVVIKSIQSMEKLDLHKTVITSPFLRVMTYRLSDGLGIMVEHEKRHFRQAKRVMESEGFPK